MDLCTRTGAEAIAERVISYWRERGYAVTCTLHERVCLKSARNNQWDVRSNIVNGLPKVGVK